MPSETVLVTERGKCLITRQAAGLAIKSKRGRGRGQASYTNPELQAFDSFPLCGARSAAPSSRMRRSDLATRPYLNEKRPAVCGHLAAGHCAHVLASRPDLHRSVGELPRLLFIGGEQTYQVSGTPPNHM